MNEILFTGEEVLTVIVAVIFIGITIRYIELQKNKKNKDQFHKW